MSNKKATMINNFTFYDSSMVRKPARKWKEYDLDRLSEFVRCEDFQMGIFLASPTLFDALERKNFSLDAFNSKEQLTVFGYYNRLHFRPTPFGFFSGFGIIEWGETRVAGNETSERLVLPDWLIKLNARGSADKSLYQLNPTIYQIGKEYRFIKTSRNSGQTRMTYALESIAVNSLLARMLAEDRQKTMAINAIVSMILETVDCGPEVARDYIDFLIDIQWLVTKIRPAITAPETPKSISDLADLRKAGAHFLADNGQPDHHTDRQLFYATLIFNNSQRRLPNALQRKLSEAIYLLYRTNSTIENQSMDAFKREFQKRYDKRKVPLLEVLDPFNGIGYQNLEDDRSGSLLDALDFQQKETSPDLIEWTEFHQILLNRWANVDHEQGIVLGESDIAHLHEKKILQPGISVLFREVRNGSLLLEGFGGVANPALIGRFTLWSKAVENMAKQLAAIEQRTNPKVIFAELLQLSDAHTDNINRRKNIYEYDIPINSPSQLPQCRQIELKDLMISVNDGNLILESLNHKKIVIPRLSSAYNYQLNQLAIFRFLADLQYDGIVPIVKPDMEKLFPKINFYPRLTFENVIISPAKWILSATELEGISVNKITHFRTTLNWPAWVALSKHDQLLVFDLNKAKDLEFFIKSLKGLRSVSVQEYFLPEEREPHVEQYISFLSNDDEVYKNRASPVKHRKNFKKDLFLPGSEWLYLKFYCSPAVADNFLVGTLRPQLLRFEKSYGIKWFFIRYYEDGYHIRLRIHSSEIYIGEIIQKFQRKLSAQVNIQLIRAYQADTYLPEWERYGVDLMYKVEDVFCAGSKLVLGWLQQVSKNKIPKDDNSFPLRSVFDMIQLFIPQNEEQIKFLERMVQSFYNEFSDDKALRVSMDKAYRKLKTELINWLGDTHFYSLNALAVENDEFGKALGKLTIPSIENTPGRKVQLLADLVHMQVNRFFNKDQRKQELMIYYCLFKYKKSQIASQQTRIKFHGDS